MTSPDDSAPDTRPLSRPDLLRGPALDGKGLGGNGLGGNGLGGKRPGWKGLAFLEGLSLARARVHEICGPARRTLALMVAAEGPLAAGHLLGGEGAGQVPDTRQAGARQAGARQADRAAGAAGTASVDPYRFSRDGPARHGGPVRAGPLAGTMPGGPARAAGPGASRTGTSRTGTSRTGASGPAPAGLTLDRSGKGGFDMGRSGPGHRADGPDIDRPDRAAMRQRPPAADGTDFIVWIAAEHEGERLHAAGVAGLVDPARLVLVAPKREADVLWAVEEALRSGAVALVIADLTTPPNLVAVRRLHLAAEAGAAQGRIRPTGLLLTPGDGGAQGVESRWHVAPRHRPGRTGWHLERRRARMATPRAWSLDGPALHLGPADPRPNAASAPEVRSLAAPARCTCDRPDDAAGEAPHLAPDCGPSPRILPDRPSPDRPVPGPAPDLLRRHREGAGR